MIDNIEPEVAVAISAALWTLWLIICAHQSRNR